LARCLSVREEASTPDPARTDHEHATKLAVACADLYSESRCSQAFRAWSQTPVTERAATVTRACRDAYCPRLTQPKPVLCAESDLPPPSAQPVVFAELNQRILSFELDLSLERVHALLPVPLSLRAPLGVEVVSAAPLPSAIPLDAPGRFVVRVELGIDPRGQAYVAIDDGQRVALPASAPEATLREVAEAARTRVTDSQARVVMHVDRKIAHGTVLALLSALRAAQFSRIAFVNDSKVDPGKATGSP
jgi:biopolymer transport protein ExbD